MNDAASSLSVSFVAPRAPRRFQILRRVFKSPFAVIASGVILILLVGAVLGPPLAPNKPDALVGRRLMAVGSAGLPLGTDRVGRDEFSRMLSAFQPTVIIAFSAAALSITLALMIGTVSGWFGGWVDAIVQRWIDAGMSFPPLILVITLVAVIGSGITQLVCVLGIISSMGASRLIRASVMTVRSEAYIDSARAVGASDARIVLKHVLPNIFGPIMVVVTISLGALVLTEASLSFLGLGLTDPAQPTWGRMLFDARPSLADRPLLAIWPGLMISLTVFAFNMLGDSLRDILDPRLRNA